MVFLAYKIGFEAFSKKLAVDLGGSKRLHALSTLMSAAIMAVLFLTDLLAGVICFSDKTIYNFCTSIPVVASYLLFFIIVGRYDSIGLKYCKTVTDCCVWFYYRLLH